MFDSVPGSVKRTSGGKAFGLGENTYRPKNAMTFMSSIEVLPCNRSVEQTDTYIADVIGLEVSRIDAHVGDLARTYPFPIHDAAARRAAHEAQRLAAPRIFFRRPGFGDDADVGGFVIRPENAVSPADRAVAAREHARSTRHFDADCLAMTRA